ncbi:MAG: helix-turn-helix domain-containing protein [Defluviitaleaceae bacterium]|nr:helix-turn-helix domain-containing protein [Defluviitaleaceae bacterium]
MKPLADEWGELEKEIFTPEEIAASDLRVAIIGELIKARNESGVSQKKLEALSGVKQPIIARMEKGSTSPQLDTVLKVLAPLGKTLYVGDLERLNISAKRA